MNSESHDSQEDIYNFPCKIESLDCCNRHKPDQEICYYKKYHNYENNNNKNDYNDLNTERKLYRNSTNYHSPTQDNESARNLDIDHSVTNFCHRPRNPVNLKNHCLRFYRMLILN